MQRWGKVALKCNDDKALSDDLVINKENHAHKALSGVFFQININKKLNAKKQLSDRRLTTMKKVIKRLMLMTK